MTVALKTPCDLLAGAAPEIMAALLRPEIPGAAALPGADG